MDQLRSWRVLLAVSSAACLAFLERAFLDWRYAYVGFPGDVGGIGLALVIYVLFVAAWLWALLAVARQQRRGVAGVLVLSSVLLVGLWIGTVAAFCPSPCQTAWPLMEASNWIGLGVGAVAAIAALARLTAPTSTTSQR